MSNLLNSSKKLLGQSTNDGNRAGKLLSNSNSTESRDENQRYTALESLPKRQKVTPEEVADLVFWEYYGRLVYKPKVERKRSHWYLDGKEVSIITVRGIALEALDLLGGEWRRFTIERAISYLVIDLWEGRCDAD